MAFSPWVPKLATFKIRNLVGTVQAIKTSPGTLRSLSVINTTVATAFVQVFNAQTGNGATVTFTVSGGAISTVTATPVAGGTGYPASSTFNLPVTSGGGTGGIVTATTNGSGVVTSFATAPVARGTGYSATTGATTGGTVLGTTTPDYEVQVPAASQVEARFPQEGLGFGTAISIASTTTEGGATTSASGVQVVGSYG